MSSTFDQINSTFDRLSADWKANDGAAVAGFFGEDGSLVNPFGERADGRTAIAAMYTDYFEGMLSGTSTTIDLAQVRDVEADHAFVDAEQAIRAPDGSVVLTLHLAALMRRVGDDWQFVDSRPFAYAAGPI